MKRIILGSGSDIGKAVAARWQSDGDEVVAISRAQLDMTAPVNWIEGSAKAENLAGWDTLLICSGTMKPWETFRKSDSEQWEEAILVNFTGPAAFVRGALGQANPGAHVIFFSGAGLHSPAPYLSAYASAKYALVKLAEVLHHEDVDHVFMILGPGWVKTKMHGQTTARPTDESFWQRMDRVVDFVCWAASQPRALVGGKRISIHDNWDLELRVV